MKLLSACIRNYRIHRDTDVDLDDRLVLIHGPNESGKSTLAEAIHCALFLKAKGSTACHEAMASNHGGTPEVEVTFEARGARHTVKKTFGKNGDTVLESEGQATLKGSEAEECLASLLGVDGAVSGGGIEAKLERRWGHLWVWQGKSSRTPLDTLEESQQQLREKLQAKSGHTVLSSGTDNAVIDSLQAWIGNQFTNTGKPKANSDLDKALRALESAQARAVAARETLGQLEQSAKQCLQAEADVKRHRANLKEAEAQLKKVREQLKTVHATRDRLKEKQRERDTAKNAFEALEAADQEIRHLETQLREAEAAVAPFAADIERLKTEKVDRQIACQAARRQREDATQKVNRLRAISDALQAHRDSLREGRRVEELGARLAECRELEEQGKALRSSLGPLEPFTDKALKALTKADRAAAQAHVRLEAYSLQVELLEADEPVTLDDMPLQRGKRQTLSQSAELEVGKTRVRLTPGGAEDLEEARKAWQAASEQLDQELKSLAVDSLEQAQERQREAENLRQDLLALEKQLKVAQVGALESQLAEAEQLRDRMVSRRDAYAPDDAGLSFTSNLASAEEAAEQARDKLTSAERECQRAEAREKASQKSFDASTEALAKAELAHREVALKRDDLRSRLNHSVEKAGEAAARSRALNEARARLDQAKAAVEAEEKALDALGAAELELNEKRLTDSISSDAGKLKDAEQRQIESRTELRRSGSEDPELQLKEAEAEVQRCERHHDSLQHQADVKRHLLEKLQAARQATTAALAKPLEDAVGPYLRSLFGGGRARLEWSEDGSRLVSFALDRSETGGGMFPFDKLSHGTREQVALTLRLATAQLLASDSEGTLPIVLDDAFTHADRERIDKLKTLLYRAAENGMQILLLSCHPENYSGLSARENALG
jgi:DNA repair exonuclease SbcCD ATPase subunit